MAANTARKGCRRAEERQHASAACCDEAATAVPRKALNGVAPLLPESGGNTDSPSLGFSSIPVALEAFKRGEPLVVLDDEDRENEGDLILAAEHATSQNIAFMVRYTSGVICVGMRGEDLDRLQIPLMVEPKSNEDSMRTAFTVTVDLKKGTTTGISASDRAATLRALADPQSTPGMFNKPGHIFPLRCRPGGVCERPGHTEASVDLAALAGCRPAGVLCEIVNDDGTMARTPELLRFGAVHGLHVITIKDLVSHIQQETEGTATRA
eukprot:CAMPEP_0177592134 /NCGR_PEP_ID=MMETSP0419_2-20121207/8389_1 /TAXON_ID=582737 /ORGANISM="Tetraselmis sp., Strain GSL018" /LENGTH=266 /DNA_ID=CAMNT_0019082963 /DNA_START=332 /DNA_END=1132 /DNA_ORIENTATION=-